MEEGWDGFGKEGQDGGGVAGMILTIWAPWRKVMAHRESRTLGTAGGGVAYGEEGEERGGV